MKPKYIIYPLLVLLVGYLIYNKFYGQKATELREAGGGAGGSSADAKKSKKGGPVPVVIKIVKDTAFTNAIDISGSIEANEQVNLHSDATGSVTGIYFKEGTHVQQGQLLVKVYDKDLQASLKQTDVQIKQAALTEYRNRMLLAKEAISKEEYDLSLTALNAYKAQAEMIKAQIAKTEIRAPFSGTIGLRYVSPGTYLTAQSNIATLVNANPAKITFSVPERYQQLIKTGSTIKFTTESSAKTFTGTVYALDPEINVGSRSLTIRAKAGNDAGLLMAGGFAKIHLELSQIPRTIMIPTEAVTPDLKSSIVWVLNKGEVKQRQVQTDTRTDTQIQITNGLKPGDSLIVSGIIQMRPKVKVKVIKVI